MLHVYTHTFSYTNVVFLPVFVELELVLSIVAEPVTGTCLNTSSFSTIVEISTELVSTQGIQLCISMNRCA